jgi:hypothetical protein
MFSAHAPERRIVQEQISKFPSLLHEVDSRHSRDLLLKTQLAKQFAQYDSRIVEAERLIEITRQQVLPLCI